MAQTASLRFCGIILGLNYGTFASWMCFLTAILVFDIPDGLLFVLLVALTGLLLIASGLATTVMLLEEL